MLLEEFEAAATALEAGQCQAMFCHDIPQAPHASHLAYAARTLRKELRRWSWAPIFRARVVDLRKRFDRLNIAPPYLGYDGCAIAADAAIREEG